MRLEFVTGNALKFKTAESVCHAAGIELHQVTADIDEIQGKEQDKIVRDKVEKAFKITGKPTVVGDDFWYIHGLNGFPGAYMKDMNDWLTPSDFLNLTRNLTDRRITLSQCLGFTDGNKTVTFKQDIPGKLLTEARGYPAKTPHLTIVAFDAAPDKTVAEMAETGELYDQQWLNEKLPQAWPQLIRWLQE